MPNVNELLGIAISEISIVNPGEIFLIRDLFKGYKWNRISKSDCLLLGTLFLNYINTTNNEVTPIEKTSSGQ
ncbi:single-stranded DNA-binding protein [Acetivibrio mesophilus]|uniref:Single-stranded DNA-binding protein n=1 Tax=Acetivibrio mesophilus TaxID=2487273 RepID=A0A4Q0I094_9FIRM|nr:single-stranded DNA-binding protein [Acetivibrio mesophilus]RXE57616.1 single-stranded DNA-binding protein [Acetivibrio mesophilus]